MRWRSIDGPPCAPRDIAPRLEQRINPQSQHRIKLQWVLDGWKWKRNPRSVDAMLRVRSK